MPKNPPPEAGVGKEQFHTPYNNILPATPLAGRPNYDADMNKRVEWEADRGPSRQAPKGNGPSLGNNQHTPKKK